MGNQFVLRNKMSSVRIFTAFSAIAMVLSLIQAAPTRAETLPDGMSASALSAMFGTYGDTSGQWSGGDGTASVALPDGRVAWLFSDTFLGTVGPDGSRPKSAPLIHNSMVLQDGQQLSGTLTGGTGTLPKSLVGGDRDSEPDNAGYWVGDGVVSGSTLQALYNHYRKTGTGGLDLALDGTVLATFELPSLKQVSVTRLSLSNKIAWGSSLLQDGDYTYVYGSELGSDTGFKFAHLARVTSGGLAGAWQFWTGSGWSDKEGDSTRLLSGVGTAFTVQKIGEQYVLVTMEGNLVFNPEGVAYTAASPTGPFTGPVHLFTAPEPQPDRQIITYDARIHPELARNGKLLVSYNVNSLVGEDNYADARLYRPRFVEVDWPRPQVDPASLPPVPTGLSASTDDAGMVRLSWQGSTTDQYWVYQRDVTAGQTHFARIPESVTGTTMDLRMLRTGHQYEIAISAENAKGESALSNTLSVTPKIPAPEAPTGLNAAMKDGKVVASWNPVPGAWNHQVFLRDVTAGQANFEPLAKVDGASGTQELRWLTNQHEYEIQVVAEHGGGPSTPSSSVRIIVRFDVPPAPTGLTASPNTDGTVTLEWTAPGEAFWYSVYQKDVTAGESDFTRLPLPVTEGTSMTAGLLEQDHVYEWAVVATNDGGESPRSNIARATAHYPPPPAPVNLRVSPGDGEVALEWDAPEENLWFWVYQRDVTASETEFTRLPLPVTDGTTMRAGYLSNGHEYEFKVASISQGGEGPASTTVRATPEFTPPAAPTALSATSNSDGSITLNWTAPGPDLYHWIYVRDVTAGETWKKLEYPVAEANTFTARYLTHNHTYEFKVSAANAGGEGPVGKIVTATSRYGKPVAPTNLRGSTDGNGSIDINWTAPGPDLYYWVYVRDTTAGETFTKSVYPTDKTWASRAGLKNGHIYEFKVTAANQGGEGPASAMIKITSLGGLPAAPKDLMATSGDGQVTLKWTPSPTANVYYWVEYRAAGESWQRSQYPLKTCCSFNMQLLTNGTAYEFRLRANNSSGDSSASNVASAKPMPPLPQPPSGLTAAPGDGQVALKWTASPSKNVYYWIDYRSRGGSWQRMKYPLKTCCSLTAQYLTNGTTYEFRVRATNLAGDSAASNLVSAKPMPPFPQPPSGLSGTPGLGKVRLSWSASATKNVYYWVEYRAAGGAWQRSKYPVSTCCSITMDYLSAASYDFRVRANNVAGDSAPSNIVHINMPLPGAPEEIRASQAGPYQAKLSWDAVAGADSYIIYHGVSRSITERPTMKRLAYPVMGKTSLTADYLIERGIHWWGVAAVKYGRVGPMSTQLATVAPLMENENYFYARHRYFDSATPSQHKKLVTSAPKGISDGGIIVARAFIGSKGAYIPISDHRQEYSADPYASARMHLAWDTSKGQLGALAQPSCTLSLCHTALPIAEGASTAGDTQPTDRTYIWRSSGDGNSLTLNWQATNSDTHSIWKIGWHIDTKISIWRSSGNNYAATLYTDHFPMYEVYQYPHYSTLGVPTAHTLVTCDQHQILGLTDKPEERRTCL